MRTGMKRLTWRMWFVDGFRSLSNLGVLTATSYSSCRPLHKVSPITTPTTLRKEVLATVEWSAHLYDRSLTNYARHKITPLQNDLGAETTV